MSCSLSLHLNDGTHFLLAFLSPLALMHRAYAMENDEAAVR